MKFILYLFEISILQALFYLVFHLFLKKQTGFITNRVYLLITLLATVTIPFIEIEIQETTPLTLSLFQIKEVVIHSNLIKPQTGSFDLNTFILLMAVLSCSVYFLLFIRQLWFIHKLFSNSVIRKSNHIYIIETNRKHAFSFFNYLFISKSIKGAERKKIIIHEKIHISQWHTVDRLFIDLILVFQWFNPFAWLYRRRIIENHEFLADSNTLKKGINLVEYQQLLLNQFFLTNQVQFVTYFNQSLIKKRIFMMTKNTNKKAERIRFFLALPLTLIIAICFSFKVSLPDQVILPISNNLNFQNAINSDTPMIMKDSLKKSREQKVKSGRIFIVVEQNATFQGGDMDKFRTWIFENLKYPESAAKKSIQGKVILSFVVEADGMIKEVNVLRGVEPALDEEGIRVIKSSPAWTPAKQGGKAVAQQFTMPIQFKLSK